MGARESRGGDPLVQIARTEEAGRHEAEAATARESETAEIVKAMLAESDREWQMPAADLDDADARSQATFWLRRLNDVRSVRVREIAELKATKVILDLKAVRRLDRRDREEADIMCALEILFGQMALREDAKSVDTLGGRVGLRLAGESMKITDETQLRLWLRGESLFDEIVEESTVFITDKALLKTVMRERLKETGEVGAPGVDYTPAEDKFYATPDGD